MIFSAAPERKCTIGMDGVRRPSVRPDVSDKSSGPICTKFEIYIPYI